MSSSATISSVIGQILREYPVEEIGEGLTENRVRRLVETDLVSQINSIVNGDSLSYKASVGKGRWTAIPWVAILDNRVTDNINEGIYVVYLFEPKQKRVSLTLNQGVKILREKHGAAKARNLLRTRAEEIRANLDAPEFTKDSLEFPDASARNELYGPGTIAYRQYNLGDIPSEETIQTDLRELVEAYQSLITSGELPYSDQDTLEAIPGEPPSAPTVWIEKTQQEGRQYKQEGELALGNAIMAPSRDEGGYKRYETMREADVGDIVLHLLQEDHQIVGLSRIASELHEDFEGPPDDRWTDEQQDQGGYLRELENYVTLEDPIDVYDDVLSNDTYTEQLQRIRKECEEKIIYTKRLSLNQGHYFTKVPADLLAILATESEDLPVKLETFGVDVPALEDELPPPVASYDTLSEAMADIHERLAKSTLSNWLADELTNTVVDDWSTVLTNFGPDSIVSPTEEVRLKQIRTLYANNEAQLREDAAELGSGELNHITEPQTLFVAFLRDLQEQAGINTNVNQVKIKIILNKEYEIASAGQDDEPPAHPILTHLDTLPASSPVRKFTAPPDYWLTALRYGTVSFEEGDRSAWEAAEPGQIALLHSRAEPSADDLPNQPSGLFGVGILGEKTTKEDTWWTDETRADSFPYLVNFDRLFVTSNLDQLDVSTPITDHSTDELGEQLEALTAGILEFDEVQSICEETNGSSFPAQGAHGVFRDSDGDPDHERPRALIAALADRLQETATVNAHAPFDGSLSTDPLAGLYFPGDEGEDIIEQVEAALRTGKHIILTGPPGTGKTEIARRICGFLAAEYPHLYSDFQLTTATADWSTFDTVGGYMPEGADDDGDELSFTPGVVLNRLKERQTGRQVNEPIIIDELNRADIDKAFGQLFTLLSGQSVQLPYTHNGEEIELLDADQIKTQPASHQYVVPNSWRIFATMNTYDKTSLYEMSYAFMRRFAFIRVGAPDLPESSSELDRLMNEYANVWEIEAGRRERTQVGLVWRAMNEAVEDRAIGPAIVEDMLGYVNHNSGLPLEERLTRAIISYIFPQLEGVPKREQILREIAAVDIVDEAVLNDAATEMLQVTIRSDE